MDLGELFTIFLEFFQVDSVVFISSWNIIWYVSSLCHKIYYLFLHSIISCSIFKTCSLLPLIRIVTLRRWSVGFLGNSDFSFCESYSFSFKEFTIVFGKFFGPVDGKVVFAWTRDPTNFFLCSFLEIRILGSISSSVWNSFHQHFIRWRFVETHSKLWLVKTVINHVLHRYVVLKRFQSSQVWFTFIHNSFATTNTHSFWTQYHTWHFCGCSIRRVVPLCKMILSTSGFGSHWTDYLWQCTVTKS